MLKVGVFVQGSNSFDGVLVILKTDHFILQPVDISLVGSILPGPQQVLIKCVQGISQAGNCPPADVASIDTVVLAVFACSGCTTTSPASGLLFTVTYQVMASADHIPIAFQVGCSQANSSVTGSTTCLVVDNAGQVVPETVQDASFTSNTPFAITPSEHSVETLSGTAATDTINITSINGFAGSVSLSAFPSLVNNVSCSLTPTTLSLTITVKSATSTLSCLTKSLVRYNVAINGTTGSTSLSTNVIVIVGGFIFATTPGPIQLERGTSTTVLLLVAPREGLPPWVVFSLRFTPTLRHEPTVSPGTQNVTLLVLGLTALQLTVTAPSSTPARSYMLVISGTYKTDSASVSIPINVVR